MTESETLLLFKKNLSLLRIWSEAVLLGWLEVFKQIIELVPMVRIQGDCISLINSLTDHSERVLSRKVGAMIICSLVNAVTYSEYMKTYLTYLRKLAEDINWEVRQVIAQKIPLICEKLGQESIKSIYEILCKLLEDKQQEVFIDAGKSLGLILGQSHGLSVFDNEIQKLKFVLAVPNSELLKVITQNIGRILVGIGKETLMKETELSAMLQTIITVVINKDLEGSGVVLAQNLPAIVLAFGPEIFISELFKVIEKLMNGKNASILAKATFANCFHEICQLFGYELSTTKLREYFFSLLCDSNILIIDSILNHVEVIIKILCPNPKSEIGASFLEEYFTTLPIVYKKLKSWRVEAKFLEKLNNIIPYINAERVTILLIPIFKKVLASSPNPCKVKVCDLLSQILSKYCQFPIRSKIHSLAKELAKSNIYHDRASYLDLISSMMDRMSKHYIKDNFLTSALELGEDKVIDIQWKFCNIAQNLKKNLLIEDVKNYDKLIYTVDKIQRIAKCKSLKDKATNTLIELKASYQFNQKEEDELYKKENELIRQELIEYEEEKKAAMEEKAAKKSKLDGKNDGKVRKSSYLASSATGSTANAKIFGVRKPSFGTVSTPTKKDQEKRKQERPQTMSKPIHSSLMKNEVNKKKI